MNQGPFTYPEIETVNELDRRWYLTPVGPLPSITTVLGHSEPPEMKRSLQQWRDSIGHAEADRVSKEATDRGTILHLLCERHLKGEEVLAPIDGVPVPADALGAYRSLKHNLKKITGVYGQEVALWSDSVGIAGRCDVVGEYKGVPSIIDFKTSKRIKTYADIHDYGLQLCFYAEAHNEMFGTSITNGIILMSVDCSMPMEFKFELPPLVSELKLRVAEFWRVTAPLLSAA